jgi:hypothetical protein
MGCGRLVYHCHNDTGESASVKGRGAGCWKKIRCVLLQWSGQSAAAEAVQTATMTWMAYGVW